MKFLSLPTSLATAMLATSFAATNLVAGTDISEEIITTATRTPRPLTETLAPVTLITAETIAISQPRDLFDVFKQVPSLSVRRNGGLGSTTSLFLRGANSDQTLVLVDGVRISSATTGTTALEHIDPDQIERIEVVRGARSSLYGADAIGGVVQIFTKRAEAGFHPEMKFSVGTDQLQEQRLTLAGGSDSVRYRVSANHQETDGFDRRNDGDEDAYRSNNISAFLSWDFNDQLQTEFSYMLNNGESEFDSSGDRFNKFRNETLSNKTSFAVTDQLKLTSTIARSTDLNDSRNHTGFGFGSIKTRRDTYDLQADYQLGDNQVITIGGELYNDRVSGDTSYAEGSRENRAFFGQYQLYLGAFELIAGWRKDDNEEFETANTRNVSVGYNINETYKVLYGYSTGFQAPSFNDLYFPGFGNPELSPESSRSNELTFKADWEGLNAEVSFFRTTFENLIETAFVGVSPLAPFGFLPANVGEARVKGFDVVVSTELAGFQLSSSYTWIDPDNQAASSDELLRRRARRSLKFNVDKQFGSFNAGLAFNAQSETIDTTVLPGYGVVDLHMGYKVSENLDLGLKITNLLDKDYQSIVTFDEDGVNAVLSLTYRPQ